MPGMEALAKAYTHPISFFLFFGVFVFFWFSLPLGLTPQKALKGKKKNQKEMRPARQKSKKK
jgi:hypothetical protein